MPQIDYDIASPITDEDEEHHQSANFQYHRDSTPPQSPVSVCTLISKVSAAGKHASQDKGPAKKVHFHSRVRYKRIKHIDDYTDREYFNTRFAEEDLEDIFAHCVDTVTQMVNGGNLEVEGLCPRGLEYKTPAGASTRKQNKARGLRVVLDEQSRQRCLGISDPQTISMLYRSAGADSRRAYRLLAVRDREEARTIANC